ncbi:unnamed protein product [Lymnaea stagnalis]|uniref:Cyclic nucleotide-binding domain-containing protein n=1 Tax=Lymnaea stagnalis TaxID=6523 RepID=A0AAV2GXS1_LYMST
MCDTEIIESLRSRLHSRRSLRHTPHPRPGTGDIQLDKEEDRGVNTRSSSSSDVIPIVKFRRKSRAVLHVIQLCSMSRRNVTTAITLEPWYALFDSDDVTNEDSQPRKRPRPFVTFVPNEKCELTQLTFDLSQFKQDESPMAVLTDSIRNILSCPPNERPSGQISKVIRYLKAVFEKFRNYPLSVQRTVSQKVCYARYASDRVIFKRGHNSTGIYFVLSGLLTEKHDTRRKPNNVSAGSVLGEYDLVCSCRRQNSVVTRADTELLYLDKKDYQEIFEMAEDNSDPKHLEIVKQHIVFQHFPLSKLEESPEAWTIVKYKYGRLIAQDSNTVEWIYVIKSGEARILKYLNPGEMDIIQRRKQVQAILRAQSPFYIKHKILNFVAERDHIQTSYSRSKYHPTTRSVMSAPPVISKGQKPTLSTRAGAQRTPLPNQRCSTSPAIQSTNQRRDPRLFKTPSQTSAQPRSPVLEDDITGRVPNNKLPEIRVDEVEDVRGDGNTGGGEVLVETDQSLSTLKPVHNVLSEGIMGKDEGSSDGAHRPEIKKDGGGFDGAHRPATKDGGSSDGAHRPATKKDGGSSDGVHRPATKDGGGSDGAHRPATKDGGSSDGAHRPETKGVRKHVGRRTESKGKRPSTASDTVRQRPPQVVHYGKYSLPAFVQVETLSQGQVFGLRACLEPEERGPSVSLVSGSCEVLQINKKFFIKHCDDALYGLIRLKAKPFPSEEDLIDRLDVGMQWEEYKQRMVTEFLQGRRRIQ